MKRYFYIISSAIILIAFTVNSFAFNIDGIIKRTEWENAETVLLLDGEESNNNTNFGLVNWKIEEGSLFLCFRYIEEKTEGDVSLSGISLIIENSEEFIVTAESSLTESDSSEYRFEGFCTYDKINGGTCEIRVGAKHGLPSEISARARFIDSNGSYSNVYEFTIHNSISVYPPYEHDNYEKPTKATTTKPTTTQTTESSISKTTQTEKTTAEKTTRKSTAKATKKNSSGLLDLILNNIDETTTQKTKQTETTKKPAKNTKKSTTKHQNTENIPTNTSAIPVSIIYVSNSGITPDVTTNISTTEGTKFKMLTAVFGGITLVTVAALGTIGANKKANKKNNKDN